MKRKDEIARLKAEIESVWAVVARLTRENAALRMDLAMLKGALEIEGGR